MARLRALAAGNLELNREPRRSSRVPQNAIGAPAVAGTVATPVRMRRCPVFVHISHECYRGRREPRARALRMCSVLWHT